MGMIRKFTFLFGALSCVLITLLAPPRASADAILSDFTLSQSIDIGTNPQSIFSLIQVNPVPTGPTNTLEGLDVNLLVSYGTIGSFTGMFFEFINSSYDANAGSVVTSLLFETVGLLPSPNYIAWDGTQVSYGIGGQTPQGGFNQITWNDDLTANPNVPQPVKNGIASGEQLLIGYTIDSANGHTYQSLLEDLLIGGPNEYDGWTIAAHIQNTSGGTTNAPITSAWLASYTKNQDSPFPPDNPVVPIPGAASLGLLGFGLIAAARRKVRK